MKIKKSATITRLTSLLLTMIMFLSTADVVDVRGDVKNNVKYETGSNEFFESYTQETGKLLTQGDCGAQGANVKYSLYDNGNLYIYGNGEMADYNTEEGEYSPFFDMDDTITRIVVEKGVTSIGKIAFYGKLDIEKVILPDGLKTIKEAAFIACNGLDSIIIPETVTEIEDCALGYKLTNGRYGDIEKASLKIYGKSGTAAEAYAGNNGFEFFAITGRNETGKCGDKVTWSLDNITGKLIISGSGDMYDYSYYDETSPFYNNTNITSVIIKEGVTSVGSYAFYTCQKINSVELPQTLKTIGDFAFGLSNSYDSSCSLKHIVLPDNVETIGRGAFAFCGLETLSISKGVKNISEDAFLYCYDCNEIEVSSENTDYVSKDGVLYSKDYSVLLYFPSASSLKTLKLPEATQGFGENCFMGNRLESNLQTIIFPEKFNDIGDIEYSLPSSVDTFVFAGEPPAYSAFYNYLSYNFNVYCRFSSESWKKAMINCKKKVNWLDVEAQGNELAIEASGTNLELNESVQLKAKLNPLIANEFLWSSSNTDVAVVSEKGIVRAIGTGTAEITVKSSDLKHSASVTIQVSGSIPEMKDYEIATLEKTVFSYNGKNLKQIPYKKLGGIYFYNSGTLYFYSFASKTTESIDSFSNVQDVYYEGEFLYVLSDNKCMIYHLTLQSVVSEFKIDGYNGNAIGADSSGRIYIGAAKISNPYHHKLLLYTPDGELLSTTSVGTTVYGFCGFDSTNGNFYMETEYDYYAWGFSHPGYGLTMGNVTNNVIKYMETASSFLEQTVITRSLSCIEYLGQQWYYEHADYAELLGNRYLTAASISSGQVKVYDSNAEVLTAVMTRSRKTPEYELEDDTYDTTSIGVRAVYNDTNGTIIMYENGKQLVEYNPLTEEKIFSVNTAHYVYNLLKYGDYVIAVEKEDDQYYMEIFRWNYDDITISLEPERTEMKVGENQQINVISSAGEGNFIADWTSSDNKIVTVTKSGKVIAWGEGEVTIRYQSVRGNVSAECKIKVSAVDSSEDTKQKAEGNVRISNNASANNYTVWSSVVNSYLFENKDGTLTRVENADTDHVIVETYTKQYKLTDTRQLKKELPIFGGFFSGEQYHFLVFGQSNPKEDNFVEVLRIVRYSKDWERIDSCSVNGANTYIPFDAGSLRMTETEGKLYVYTCHEMYDDGDGLHHQANMTFVVSEDDMSILDSYSDVMNIYSGYVSHSFNQLIATDGEYVYRADHGDAHLRAVSLTKCRVDGSVTAVSWKSVLNIGGSYSIHHNSTGASIGGMVLSEENCLIAGNSVEQSEGEDYDVAGQRNIFLTVTDKNLEATELIWLTNYTDGSIIPGTPQIMALQEEHYLILWEEYNSSNNHVSVKAVTCDSDGTLVAKKSFDDSRLSDCQPIFASDGSVKWYVTDGEELTFYSIAPYFSALYGDANEDGIVDVKDSALIKRYLAGWSVGIDTLAADVNRDNAVDIKDSALLKRYLAGWEVKLG